MSYSIDTELDEAAICLLNLHHGILLQDDYVKICISRYRDINNDYQLPTQLKRLRQLSLKKTIVKHKLSKRATTKSAAAKRATTKRIIVKSAAAKRATTKRIIVKSAAAKQNTHKHPASKTKLSNIISGGCKCCGTERTPQKRIIFTETRNVAVCNACWFAAARRGFCNKCFWIPPSFKKIYRDYDKCDNCGSTKLSHNKQKN